MKTLKKIKCVYQKGFVCTTPHSDQPIIGTESVTSCYAIALYHKEKSMVIHWDDNVKRNQLDVVTKAFLGDNIPAEDCRVTIIGGWSKNPSSSSSGDFIVRYFNENTFPVTLNHYKTKKRIGKTMTECGFHHVLLDSLTGEITVSDNWEEEIDGDYGPDHQDIVDSRQYLDNTHVQDDRFEDSGTILMSRENYHDQTQEAALKLCKAARDNNKDDLINLLDHEVTDIDFAPKQGWTALHFAYAQSSFECADTLIRNGANLHQQNNAKKTPLQLKTSLTEEQKQKLEAIWKILQFNIKEHHNSGKPSPLLAFSLYSRNKRTRLHEQEYTQIEALNSNINDPKKRADRMRWINAQQF